MLGNLPKNEIEKFIAPKPIQNSTRDLVWMYLYRMIICTFRKNLGKIRVDIPSHFNIEGQHFWKIYQNLPKKLKLKHS